VTHFSLEQEKYLILPGAVGPLEVITVSPLQPKPITAIICHPHPLFGGTMNNKVVHTVAKALNIIGIKTIRFNYRGVGKSAGSYGTGLGEVEDVKALVAWLKAAYPRDALWLAGFSFGAFVAAKAATELSPATLITIAPSVEHFDFTKLGKITCPWLVIQGEADEVVPSEKVFAWLKTLAPAPTLIRFPGVGHFFHGELTALREAIVKHFSAKVNHG